MDDVPALAVAPRTSNRTRKASLGHGATLRPWLAFNAPDGGLPAYVDREGNPVTAVDRAALIKDLEGGGGDPYVLDMVKFALGPRPDSSRAPRTPPRSCSWPPWLAVLPPGDEEVRRCPRGCSANCTATWPSASSHPAKWS